MERELLSLIGLLGAMQPVKEADDAERHDGIRCGYTVPPGCRRDLGWGW